MNSPSSFELQLQLNLQEFGLNPKDWQVKYLSEESALASHCHEPLVLIGGVQVMAHVARWQDLEFFEDELLAVGAASH